MGAQRSETDLHVGDGRHVREHREPETSYTRAHTRPSKVCTANWPLWENNPEILAEIDFWWVRSAWKRTCILVMTDIYGNTAVAFVGQTLIRLSRDASLGGEQKILKGHLPRVV